MFNAIVMLCMLKEHYMIGACINAFINKALMKTNNIHDIKLVIMCDDYIYNNYYNILINYFDEVIKINLRNDKIIEFKKRKLSTNTKYNWLNYSLNKWECLKYVQYDKILFLDIDILPVHKNFYNIFNLNTPALKITTLNNKYYFKDINNELNNNMLKYNSYKEYIKYGHFSINGGIFLLKPSLESYNKYYSFINTLYKENNGIYQQVYSGIDETTLYYFFHIYNINIYTIDDKYIKIPWNDFKNKINNKMIFYSYNYLSYIKPWNKPKYLEWNEEYLWRDIYKKMINITKDKKLHYLYKKNMLNSIQQYFSFDEKFKLKYYNKQLNFNQNINYNQIKELEKNIIYKKYDYGNINSKTIKKLFKSIHKYNNIYINNKKIY